MMHEFMPDGDVHSLSDFPLSSLALGASQLVQSSFRPEAEPQMPFANYRPRLFHGLLIGFGTTQFASAGAGSTLKGENSIA